VQRASTLFVIEETGLISPFVEKVWRTHSEPAEEFISVAANYSQIVFTPLRRAIVSSFSRLLTAGAEQVPVCKPQEEPGSALLLPAT
jgi:hypothetical protein